MNPQDTILFLPSGCLSVHALGAFHSNKLSEQELRAVNNHIAACPFCSDAVDGYGSRASFNEQVKIVEHLKQDVLREYKEEKTTLPLRRNFRLLLPIAASILLLIGVLSLFRLIQNHRENAISQVQIPHEYKPDETVIPSEQHSESGIQVKKLEPPQVTLKSSTSNSEKSESHPLKKLTGKTTVSSLPSNIKEKINQSPADESENSASAGSTSSGITEPGLTRADETENFHLAESNFTKAGPSGKEMQFYYLVEDMPRFQTGDLEKFREYVQKKIRYPKEAILEGIEGTVYVSFVIEPSGKISNCSIYHGVSNAIDEEAVKVVAASPEWKPGKHKGVKVKVGFIIPVRFQLD
jgi:TonB family protein